MATPTADSHTSTATKVVAAVGTVAALLVGLWFFAGVVAPDYILSIVLGAAWFVLGSFLVGRVWKRYPDLKWATRGALFVTAGLAAAGFYWTSVRDKTVDETVVTGVKPGASAPQARGDDSGGGRNRADEPPPAQNVEEASGEFIAISHGSSSGNAAIVRLPDGERKLTFTDFSVPNGPDLRVYLVPGDGTEASDNHDLGALKGNKGDQQYDIPSDVDTDRYRSVLIWCRAFSVGFSRAPLEAQ
jgi:hypothetical protein